MSLLFRYLCIGLLVGVALGANAQKPLYTLQQRTTLNRLSQSLQQNRQPSYLRAVEIARNRRIPLRQERSDGTVLMLSDIDERGNLLFNATTSTTRAGNTTRTSALYSGGSLGLSLSGNSATVRDKLGIWDGGKVRPTHVELAGRVTQRDSNKTISNHPTHVAGIMIGQGVNERTRGMAFGANLKAYDFDNDDAEIAAAAPDLLLSNHSYNIVAGWLFNADRAGDLKWEWWGDSTVSASDDYKFGIYNNGARSLDRIAVAAPYYLLVKSAGNTHGQNGPGAGISYWIGNSNTMSKTARNNQNGYDQISTDCNAKNILSVGAVSSIPTDYAQPSDVRLASFSSWGPTDDGRIKPDLVGVGVSVLSAGSASDNAYTTLSGTSMAAPNVSGSLLLLQEYYAQLHNGQFMRSSTLKGLALHTTNEAGDAPGPDYRFGWGLLNAEKAARVIGNVDKSHLLEERTLNQGDKQTVQLVASGRGPLVVTICWTDPEAAALTATAANFNNRTPRLVNDLDIRVADGSQTRQPWVLDPANPANPATRGDNVRDNVEQILIADAIPGKTYTLTISHKNTLLNGKQDFALIVSGTGGKEYCASAATSTGSANIDRVRFGTIDQAGSAGCQTYSDFTNATASVSIGQKLPLDITIGSCGENRPTITKAFIDWNIDGDFDDADELVATSSALTTSAVFSGTVTTPSGLIDGQSTRMRIVTVATADANAVQACGNYANGETQDYQVRFVRPQNDVGISAVLSPQNGFCNQTDFQVVVTIRNYGSTEQRNIPVSVQILAPFGTAVANLRDTLKVALGPSQETQLLLRGQGEFRAATAYRFIIQSRLATDQNMANDELVSILTTSATTTEQGSFSVSACDNSAVSLRNTGSGTAFWYDAPTGGNLIGAGNQATALSRPASGIYYAALNQFTGVVGPPTKQTFGGGTYSGNFGPQPVFSTQVPIVLESARLYIGSAGRITFTVQKPGGAAVSSVTLDVTPTRSANTPVGTPPAGQLSDDPTDPGAEYLLNLSIPEAGTYSIAIAYEDGASIFRSNLGVTGFPFQIPGVMSLKGSLFNSADTLTTAYYYLYNLRVKAAGCPASERVAVTPKPGAAVVAVVTPDGSPDICRGTSVVLRAKDVVGYSYQWFLNGQAVSGAMSSTLSVAAAGSYSVRASGECPPATSAAVVVTVKDPQAPTITRDGYKLTSNAATGNQWFLNGVPIPGANQQSYTAQQSGKYSVRANANGCAELLSQEITLDVITAVNPPALAETGLRIFPNPVAKQVTIAFVPESVKSRTYRFTLVDVRGVALRSGVLGRTATNYSGIIDVATLPAGLFFVLIQDEEGRTVQRSKVIKQ
ncbi:S8 family serine peptidase [Larkinella rosea]|uniref:T9SS C-terminal target domain-containing protein n=1 Tax=Larkinella rosea TaxID=2025312 RepID=A0A3P1BSU7_9BACT|nr:S8 family serine peptidase [Larkinella rosea]RRB04127.1 T9SS C-terminal target domain-containing protein [Larkinella rosea]